MGKEATMIISSYPCCVCGTDIHEEEVIWATPDGRLTVDYGEPYCQHCLPPEPDKGT